MIDPTGTPHPDDTWASARAGHHHAASATLHPAGPHLHPDDNAHWDPESYREFVASLPYYSALQHAVCEATADLTVQRMLELGVGTGETSGRLLDAHPTSTLVGLDLNQSMLGAARDRLPADRAHLVLRRIEEPLPLGVYDLAVSVLTVHHLNAGDKRTLFSRVHERLEPGGCFVIGDIVLDHGRSPDDHLLSRRLKRAPRVLWKDFKHSDRDLSALLRIVSGHVQNKVGHDDEGDQPETVVDQLQWLEAAGFTARSTWRGEGCAVLTARKRP